MRTKKWTLLIPGMVLATLLVGCDEPPPAKENPVRPIKFHAVGSLEPSAFREYPGTIRAYQTAEMSFEVAGLVTEFLVQEGEQVEKDAVLARLDASNYEAEFEVALANLEKAQGDLARSESIFKEDPGAISGDDIERDKRAAKVFAAQLEIAQKAVDDSELRAPFAGVMARKLVEDFANVKAGESVLILQDTSILEIQVDVPERDLVRLPELSESKDELNEMTERLAPIVIVSALPDREFPAVIKEYATIADPVTRTFPVKLNFENPPDVNILPGMTARVKVVVDRQSAWSVPVTAVQADANDQPYVWKVDPTTMKVSRCPVEVGPLTGDRAVLTGGVEKGDIVAISGVTWLSEGMQVRKFEN